MNIGEIITKMGFGNQAVITAFKHEDDDSDYAVWKIEDGNVIRVLKKTSKQELDIYDTFLSFAKLGVPRFYKSIEYDGELFILMEYLDGNNLQKCDRKSLTAVLDALIYLQNMYWEKRELEQAYEKYLQIYSNIPRTLCHDDLLPFNVICTNEHAVIIDWEYAGILPYPTSLARLLAHCEEDESAFFYMRQEDKEYAIEYYFEHLLKEKGIDYSDYRKTLDYFLLYEYCEWIMLGVEYNDTENERFKKYYAKAKEHIKKLI